VICPFCDSEALELRPKTPNDGATLHVYKCLNCNHIFTDIFVKNHASLERTRGQRFYWVNDQDDPPVEVQK